jgi:hypothetical protein
MIPGRPVPCWFNSHCSSLFGYGLMCQVCTYCSTAQTSYLNIAGCILRGWAFEWVAAGASGGVLDSKCVIHNGIMVCTEYTYFHHETKSHTGRPGWAYYILWSESRLPWWPCVETPTYAPYYSVLCGLVFWFRKCTSVLITEHGNGYQHLNAIWVNQ